MAIYYMREYIMVNECSKYQGLEDYLRHHPNFIIFGLWLLKSLLAE